MDQPPHRPAGPVELIPGEMVPEFLPGTRAFALCTVVRDHGAVHVVFEEPGVRQHATLGRRLLVQAFVAPAAMLILDEKAAAGDAASVPVAKSP